MDILILLPASLILGLTSPHHHSPVMSVAHRQCKIIGNPMYPLPRTRHRPTRIKVWELIPPLRQAMAARRRLIRLQPTSRLEPLIKTLIPIFMGARRSLQIHRRPKSLVTPTLVGSRLCSTFNPNTQTILNPVDDRNSRKVATQITNMTNRNTTTTSIILKLTITMSMENIINQPRQKRINIGTDLQELVLVSSRVNWNRKQKRWKRDLDDC